MRIFLKIIIVCLVISISVCFSAFAIDNKQSEKAMGNCIKKEIQKGSVMIGKYYSDPGGTKKSAAKERCEYEKSKNPKQFNKKYSQRD